MKNQVDMTLPKETSQAPLTDHKEMEISELSDAEFRIFLFGNLGNY